MTFANPQYLILLAATPAAVVLILLAELARRRALAKVGEPFLLRRLTGSVNTPGRLTRSVLTIAALGLALVAVARPQWGETEQIVERHGVQLMVAMDISRSMLAEDMKPNRLTRAKLEIADLFQRLEGDEVGLVLFAGAAFVQFPLTFDYATARTFLDNAETSMIARQGTAMAEAIDVSIRGLDNDRSGHKAILIVTDGENDPEESDPVAAARRAAEAGLTIYTIGVGTSEGERIPLRDSFNNLIGFQEDRNRNVVVTRIDEDVLRRVARAGGGQYISSGESSNAAAMIARELDGLEESVVESEITSARVERFQLFAGLAIALLAAGRLVPDRRREARPAGAAGAV